MPAARPPLAWTCRSTRLSRSQLISSPITSHDRSAPPPAHCKHIGRSNCAAGACPRQQSSAASSRRTSSNYSPSDPSQRCAALFFAAADCSHCSGANCHGSRVHLGDPRLPLSNQPFSSVSATYTGTSRLPPFTTSIDLAPHAAKRLSYHSGF